MGANGGLMKTKICTKCKKEKSLDEFPRKGSNRKGLRAQCKVCKNKDACDNRARNKKENPEQYFENNFKHNIKGKYGLTVEQWQQMFDGQRGCCSICGIHQSEIKRRLDVEHNHNTGKVRSLACVTCNKLIDICETKFYGLENKIRNYLERNNG